MTNEERRGNLSENNMEQNTNNIFSWPTALNSRQESVKKTETRPLRQEDKKLLKEPSSWRPFGSLDFVLRTLWEEEGKSELRVPFWCSDFVFSCPEIELLFLVYVWNNIQLGLLPTCSDPSSTKMLYCKKESHNKSERDSQATVQHKKWECLGLHQKWCQLDIVWGNINPKMQHLQ